MGETAVEWIEDKIQSDMTFIEILGLIRQAKEMEKQQIMAAFNEGEINSVDYFNVENITIEEAEQYYNETFEK